MNTHFWDCEGTLLNIIPKQIKSIVDSLLPAMSVFKILIKTILHFTNNYTANLPFEILNP